MFSHRTRWKLSENAIARVVEAHSSFIDLTETNPTAVDLPTSTLILSLSKDALSYHPIATGLLSAREAVSRYHSGRVPPDHLCLTASTSEAYSWLFKVLCDPGDSVLVPTPGYPLFDYLAAMENVFLAPYRTQSWDDWSIDFDHLEAQIGPTTRAIILVSPNNPTGAMLHATDLPRLTELCQRHSLALICDEVFAEYATPNPARVPTLAGYPEVLTFVLSGLSKACLSPQLKVGWIAVSGPETLRREALARLEVIADSFLSVSTPSQLVVPGLLASRRDVQQPLLERIAANRETLRLLLTGTAASLLPSDGGWSAIVRVPAIQTEEEWVVGLLKEGGVLVHPGYFFDFEAPAWLVVSLIVPESRFRRGAEALAEYVRSKCSMP